MISKKQFPKCAGRDLKYYVYIYSDPDTKKPFYVGKGKGNRCFDHLFEEKDTEKNRKIEEIINRGKEPIIEILVSGLDEGTAYKIEAAIIDLIGLDNLTNIVPGKTFDGVGKINVNDIINRYDKYLIEEKDIDKGCLVLGVSSSSFTGQQGQDLYEAVRLAWKIDENKRNNAKYALVVHEGKIINVYKIAAWFPAYTTTCITERRYETKKQLNGRFDFVGCEAEQDILDKYVGRILSGDFWRGNNSPIKMICDK